MVRRMLYAAGAVLIGVGLAGIGRHIGVVGWAIWFAGVAVAHDAVFAPLVFGAAYVTRRAPAVWRRAAVVAGTVTLVALPAVLGFGRRSDNPSVLPQAYGRHLVAIVTLIGLVTGAVAALNAYARPMGKAILSIVGVLLAIWLVFMVIGMIISALKFLIWIGFLAVIGAVIVTLISKMAKSS
ncbi:hypothetical protein GCM10023191_054940 [Actinoallomurus oryzae]|uniref:DUF308 domain-containing protein n=2 Tax=Actinoallomurus oryzae TaxID=502180 RepID=A0ABP8QHY2_9ACTN